MSDWDFLWDMRDQGYSTDEIMEAASCGYNPFFSPKSLFSPSYYDEYDDEYFEALRSEQAKAIAFTRKYLSQAKGHWVDMLAFRECVNYPDDKEKKFAKKNPNYELILCELFEKKILPEYPSEDDFIDEYEYYRAVRKITWETANKDIEQQRLQGIKPPRFKMIGHYEERKNNGYFRDDAPPEIKALERNINDRTNPLWDIAHRYLNKNFNPLKFQFVCNITKMDY